MRGIGYEFRLWGIVYWDLAINRMRSPEQDRRMIIQIAADLHYSLSVRYQECL